jgi:hypothetical protein
MFPLFRRELWCSFLWHDLTNILRHFGEERMIRRFLVDVNLGISGAFDSTRLRKKAFRELFLFSL